jgi:methionine aminotransferase
LLHGSQFELLPCEGTYFQTARYETISQENDIEFSKKLLIDHGVATIPLSPFFASGTTLKCIRFCFAKEDTTLEKAALLLRKL